MLSEGHTAIVHFVGDVKPWMEWCNPPVAKLWWHYARQIDSGHVQPTRIRTANQARRLAQILDRNEGLIRPSARWKSMVPPPFKTAVRALLGRA